MTTINMF